MNAQASQTAARPGTPVACGPQLGAPPSLEQVPLDRLQVDPTYQRATDSPASRLLINSMIKAWDWSLFQPLAVSRRPDGSLWVLDGQHRLAAARQRGDIPFLPCVLQSSLTHQDEAKTFVGLNTRRQRLNQGQIFHAQLAAGDPGARLVQQMLDDSGWRVCIHRTTSAYQAGDLECAPMLVRALSKLGEHRVRFALNTLRAAYPEIPVRPSATLLKALFEIFDFVGEDEDAISTAALVATMGRQTPDEWVTAGYALRDQNENLSHIAGIAKALHDAAPKNPPLPKSAPAPARTPPPRRIAAPALPAEPPVFGTSGKGWCDQCETLRTRDQAKACTSPFCKLRPAAQSN